MYTAEMLASILKVEEQRSANMAANLKRLTAEEKEKLLSGFHPDYKTEEFNILRVGPNKGDRVPIELAEQLESHSRIRDVSINLNDTDYDVDVLVIGGGGAASSAAIEAHEAGADVMIVTKLRIGDANTMMAEGGVQAATKDNDSLTQHYLDSFGGGHYAAVPQLLKKLIKEGPGAIKWLIELGVMFDKEPDGTLITTSGGGVSRNRVHACADYTGAEIMRTLRDEVFNREIPVIEFTAAVELILDEDGKAAGAVLLNMETGQHMVAKAKTVIIATGGAGRLHYQGFPTSNHYGATADGLVLAYRAGVELIYAEAFQYHPTGAAYPTQIFGCLVTEKVRALGARLINIHGEAFINPLETRDVTASGIIRECSERGNGITTPQGQAVWLDSPQIEILRGKGTIEKSIPAMLRMFMKYDIDMREKPILVYPTLHYQNGGIKVNLDCSTVISNLFVAGEAVGGIHGRNRLLGNSMLDIIVFGRSAGKNAAQMCKSVKLAKPTLAHIDKYSKEMKSAGIETENESPLLLPKYARTF